MGCSNTCCKKGATAGWRRLQLFHLVVSTVAAQLLSVGDSCESCVCVVNNVVDAALVAGCFNDLIDHSKDSLYGESWRRVWLRQAAVCPAFSRMKLPHVAQALEELLLRLFFLKRPHASKLLLLKEKKKQSHFPASFIPSPSPSQFSALLAE